MTTDIDVSNHYHAKISTRDWLNLLLWKVFCCGSCSFNNPRWQKVEKLYDMGMKRVDEDFDAQNYLNLGRISKVFFKENNILNESMKFRTIHHDDHVIDLDEDRFSDVKDNKPETSVIELIR